MPGGGLWRKRKLRANPPDYPGACRELLRWDRQAGRVLPGLSKRRQEILLLEEGADPTLRNQAKASALDMALANERKQSAYYLRAFIEAWEIKEAGE